MGQAATVITWRSIAMAIASCLLPAAAMAHGAWADETQAAAVQQDLAAFFKDAQVRYAGSPGNLAAEEKVAHLFESSGLDHGEIKFRAPCFLPGRTTLTPLAPSAGPLTLKPMHPSVIRPGNFTERDFVADVIYIDPHVAAQRGLLEALRGKNLKDAIILQENSGGYNFMAEMGAKGFVFIEPQEYGIRKSGNMLPDAEIRLPRFWISAADGARLKDAVKAANGCRAARVQAEPSRWDTRLLRDLWAFVPGRDPALEQDVVVITAPLDSNGIVPELAEGGTAGANLHLLLKLFDEYRRQPPARSVLFAAVNASHQAWLGERMLAWHLLAPDQRLEQVRTALAEDVRMEEMMTGHYRDLKLEPATHATDRQLLIDLRTLTDRSLGRAVKVKDPLVRQAKKDVNRLRMEQTEPASTNLPPETSAARHAALERERREYVDILTLFNRVGLQTTLDDLSPAARDILRGYVRDILAAYRHSESINRYDIALHDANQTCRRVLAGRRVCWVTVLRFDWSDVRVGLHSGNDWSLQNWQSRFGRNTTALAAARPEVASGRKANLFVDTMTMAGGMDEGYYFPVSADEGPLAVFHATDATPAFSLMNVDGVFAKAASPGDTFAALNATNVASIINFTPGLMRAWLDDPAITTPAELPPVDWRSGGKRTCMWSGRVRTYAFDPLAADVMPTLPVPESAVILRQPLGGMGFTSDGVIMTPFLLTDDRAQGWFYNVPWPSAGRRLLCDAFHYDRDFIEVDHVVDGGDVHHRVKSDIINEEDITKTLALFKCREFPIWERHDSSLVASSGIREPAYMILSAARNSPPSKYGFYGMQSLMSSKSDTQYGSEECAVYAEPGEAIKVVTKYKRMVLNASAAAPEGAGFTAPAEMTNGFYATALRDMTVLNEARAANMRGVTDELITDFLRRGREAIRKMDAAWLDKDYAAWSRSACLAMGAEVKAYRQLAAITNDMLKAVIFYMALMLPFCFFVQRLVFKTVRAEAQMGLFVLIFVLTFLAFRMIHPAFRISESPEAMFIAFVMGALAIFVISILHRRFEGEMHMLFSAYGDIPADDVAFGTAGREALMIGVQNMRRRRVRTALTTATIVLVTFTMLAFSSISKKMSPTIIPAGKSAPYTGLMYHWPGRPMDGRSASVVRNLFRDRGDVITRFWQISPRSAWGDNPKRRPIPLRAQPQNIDAGVDAVLGLDAREDGFLGMIPLLPGGHFFSADDAMEVIVPAALASVLRITPGNMAHATVHLLGCDYRVAGILDDERFMTLRDMDGAPLVPIQVNMSRKLEAESADHEMENATRGTEYVPMSMLLLMPQRCVQRLAMYNPSSQPYSVSVRFADEEPLWPHIEDMLMATDAKFYVSSRVPFKAGLDENARSFEAGVYFVGAGYRTSIGGLAVLIIPLLIAGTIILNTMLGSVYERRSEIAIYNAVGLNPTHIGIFFVAEAFVYGVIGSVGGYLAGQSLVMACHRMGWVGDLNLNFSSLNVVYVILFTLAVVMLSTLYPAYVATRAAVPSGKRKWSMPRHNGRRMDVPFPFIYMPEALPGVMRYIEVYFNRYTEVSIGDLLARLDRKEAAVDPDGHPVYRLQYHVALAPYDLGVTQTVTFAAGHDKTVGLFRVLMTIERESGQDADWVATNRPFLDALRQHLMRWRTLEPAMHKRFIEEGRRAFGPAPEQESI